MKKITIIVLFIGLSVGVMAQKTNLKYSVKTNESKTSSIYYPSSFNNCGSLTNANLSGFIYLEDTFFYTGANPIFNAIAQKYNITATVTGVAAVLVNYRKGSDTVALNINLYNSDFTQVLATTTYDPSLISTDGDLYQYTFNQPVENVSSFNIAFTFPTYTDTSNMICVTTTEIGCSSNLAKYVNYNGWTDYTALFGNTVDFDIMLFPIISGESGLNNVESINLLTYVYPNPAKDQVVLASSYKMNRIEIFNLMGQKVYENAANGISSIINVENYTPGTYVVKIYTEEGLATKKIVVE